MPGRGPPAGREDPPDPVGELRLARGAGGLRLGLHQQVQRGLRRQALLRGPAVRRSARVAVPASAPCELFGAEHANVQPYSGSPANLAVYLAFLQAGRQGDGPGPAHGRPPHPRLERLHHRQVLPVRAVRRPQGHRPHRLRRGPRPGPQGEARPCCGPAAPPTRASGTSRPWPTSPRRSAPASPPTSPTSPGWSRAAPTPRRCPTPTWSPPPPTRPCAARAAA